MRKRTVLWLALAGVLSSLLTASASSADHKYTSERDCSRCHNKDLIGDQTKAWKSSAHAKAFKTLKGDEAVKIAKERGMTELPHQSDKCLRCHATAQGLSPEQMERPLRLADGVQCESCHGPGSDYKGNEIMVDRAKAIAAGMWEPGKDEKICTACHNDQGPNYKGFDYEESKKKIAHPIPENVKGHYLELEAAEGGKTKERRRE